MHGSIGHCHSERDGKVKLITYFVVALPTPSLSETVSLPRLPSAGGVYSPGYAFADTTLVSRLDISLSASELQSIHNAQFSFFQVEQKGRHIHIRGGGYLIFSARNIRQCNSLTLSQ